mmetsp:Transcript_72683/g.173514  ORF Transcript_72683/g.173514 Transcript_72683/m.173514 type:complete len:325 (-) Transcript_72683:2388-3362(-)
MRTPAQLTVRSTSSRPRPNAELCAKAAYLPSATWTPLVRAYFDRHLVIDDGGIKSVAGNSDVELRRGVNVRISADGTKLKKLLADKRSSDIVPVEDGWHARVRQDQSVASQSLIVVAKAASDNCQLVGVVVVNEGTRPRRIPARNASKPATTIHLLEIVAVNATLQCVVQREVVDGHETLALAHVVVKPVGVAVPVLGHREGRAGRSHVVRLEARGVALHEVEAQRPEADLVHQVPDIFVDICLDAGVGVVHAGRVRGRLSRGVRPAATGNCRAVVAHCPTFPIWLLELQPSPGRILQGCTAVVYHHIQHWNDLLLVHALNQVL